MGSMKWQSCNLILRRELCQYPSGKVRYFTNLHLHPPAELWSPADIILFVPSWGHNWVEWTKGFLLHARIWNESCGIFEQWGDHIYLKDLPPCMPDLIHCLIREWHRDGGTSADFNGSPPTVHINIKGGFICRRHVRHLIVQLRER